jgi:hypothetical protein
VCYIVIELHSSDVLDGIFKYRRTITIVYVVQKSKAKVIILLHFCSNPFYTLHSKPRAGIIRENLTEMDLDRQ